MPAPTKDRLRLQLMKSGIGCTVPQKLTLRGLGLTRREKIVVLEDTPSVRGMVRKVIHLVRVEEI
jgi:large subunit ribosomal protein L30